LQRHALIVHCEMCYLYAHYHLITRRCGNEPL
jgi:hypothetical protein